MEFNNNIDSTMLNLNNKNLDALTSKITNKNETEEKLRKAANEFEAVFVKQLMEIMDSTVEKSDFLNGGRAEETFKSMINDQIATDISSNKGSSFGLAEQIYQQMKNRI